MLPFTVPAMTTALPKLTISPITVPLIATVPPNAVRVSHTTVFVSTTTAPPNDGPRCSSVQCCCRDEKWWLSLIVVLAASAGGVIHERSCPPPLIKNVESNASPPRMSIARCATLTFRISELPIIVSKIYDFQIARACYGTHVSYLRLLRMAHQA